MIFFVGESNEIIIIAQINNVDFSISHPHLLQSCLQALHEYFALTSSWSLLSSRAEKILLFSLFDNKKSGHLYLPFIDYSILISSPSSFQQWHLLLVRPIKIIHKIDFNCRKPSPWKTHPHILFPSISMLSSPPLVFVDSDTCSTNGCSPCYTLSNLLHLCCFHVPHLFVHKC